MRFSDELKKHLPWIVPLVVLAVITLDVFYWGFLMREENSMKESLSKEEQIRVFVEDFGERLKEVSLLSPKASEQIEAQYAEYVSPNLLLKWKKDPKEAPGRLTSSPWPEELVVKSVSQSSSAENIYQVTAHFILMTSKEKVSDDPDDNAGVRYVTLTVEREIGREETTSYLDVGLIDRWKITGYTLHPMSGITYDDDTFEKTKNPALVKSCEISGGNWLEKYHECEHISGEWCIRHGGAYEFCDSACRHNPKAKLCTMQCVQVCKLSSLFL